MGSGSGTVACVDEGPKWDATLVAVGGPGADVSGDEPRRRLLWVRALGWAGWLLAGLLAVVVAVRWLGLQSGPLLVVVAMVPWLAVLGVGAVVVAMLSRSWLLLLVSGALLGVMLAWQLPVYVADRPSGGAPEMRVASVNLALGRADTAAVVDLVRRQDVDVLAVQELTPAAAAALEAGGLDELLPYRDARPHAGASGSGLWSRFPIKTSRRVDGFISATIQAEVTTPLGPMTVFAVHPDAPGQMVHDRWARELQRLHDVLAQVSGPVVVAGDFNSTRDHVQFRELEALGYIDAADQAGAGLQPTFPQGRGPWPWVTIDHVMVRDTPLTATGLATFPIPDADHNALVVAYSQ